jgi:hypothetical protein
VKNNKTKSVSEKDSSFFSGQSPSEITSINNKENGSIAKNYLSEVLSSNDNGSNNIIKEVIELKAKNSNKEIIDDDIYSIYSKEGSKESKESKKSKESKGISNLKKEKNAAHRRDSLKSMQGKKVKRSESRKNMRVSVKLSGLKFRKKESEHASIYDLIAHKTTFDNKIKKAPFVEEKLEKVNKEEGNGEEEEKEAEEEEEEEDEEDEEYDEDEEGEEEEDESSLSFNSRKSENEIDSKNKINLVEYDMFYKEQFLRNDVFEYDVENIKDEESEKINKEINKLEIERKLFEKKKLKKLWN